MKYLSSFLLIILLLLSGCGFHFNNHTLIAPQLKKVYIQSANPYGKLEVALRNRLQSLGVTVTDDPQQAPVIINILQATFTQSTPYTLPNTQQTVYLFTFSTSFNLITNRGKQIVGNQNINTKRNFVTSPSQILENSPELNTIKQTMLNNVLQQLIYRLNSQTIRTKLTQLNEHTTPAINTSSQ